MVGDAPGALRGSSHTQPMDDAQWLPHHLLVSDIHRSHGTRKRLGGRGRAMMHPTELTISDMLRDPIIHQVLQADGISLPAFVKLLQQAARRQHEMPPLDTSNADTGARDLRPETGIG